MTETEFTREFGRALIRTGAMVVPLVGSTRGVNGMPDRMIVSTLWAGLVEFKGPKTPLKVHQAKLLIDFEKRQRGFFCVARMRDDSGRMLGLRTCRIESKTTKTGSRLVAVEDEFAVVPTANALDFLSTLARKRDGLI